MVNKKQVLSINLAIIIIVSVLSVSEPRIDSKLDFGIRVASAAPVNANVTAVGDLSCPQYGNGLSSDDPNGTSPDVLDGVRAENAGRFIPLGDFAYNLSPQCLLDRLNTFGVDAKVHGPWGRTLVLGNHDDPNCTSCGDVSPNTPPRFNEAGRKLFNERFD